jgi:hypothetical protein
MIPMFGAVLYGIFLQIPASKVHMDIKFGGSFQWNGDLGGLIQLEEHLFQQLQ